MKGPFTLVRQTAVQQVGLLDERFYFYGEDLDWALRFRQRGWKVYYYPGVQILHYKGQTSRKQSQGMVHEFYEAMRVFYRKHYAAGNPLVLRWLVLAAITLGEWWARIKNCLQSAHARHVSP